MKTPIGVLRLLAVFRTNWISRAGAVITTLSFMGIVTTFLCQLFGIFAGPYFGLLTFLVLPGFFVVGLIAIPVGLVIYRKQIRDRLVSIQRKPLPVLKVLGTLTVINLVLMGFAGYEGMEYMDSVEFCGTVCHTVMQPQFDAYLESPHARVKCVECHIGPGASWFVKSKLSGLRQVFAVMFETYPKPIPTPVVNLRPARDTCEECHWPDKFQGDKFVARSHYSRDRDNTRKTNVLVLKTGGVRPGGEPTGIHWHVHEGNEVTYLPTDEKRNTIPWVRLRNTETGEEEIFTTPGFDGDVDPKKLRRMDCIDCHNQPSHIYHRAHEAMNNSMDSGAISADLPFVKREGRAVLQKEWESADAAASGIRADLEAFYASEEPLTDTTRPLLEPAIEELVKIWRRNVYPEMGVRWDTYRSFEGHHGCLRCHDDEHVNEQGRSISLDCDTCHAVLGYMEEKPEILETLGTGEVR